MSTYVYGITAASHPSPARGHGRGRRPGPPGPRPHRGRAGGRRQRRPRGAAPQAAGAARPPERARRDRRGRLRPAHAVRQRRPDDDAVTSVLAERAEHYLERLLRALDGRVEYNVKANHVEEAVLHHVMATNPEIRALAEANRPVGGGSYDDKIRLGEMVAEAVKAREAEDGAALENALHGIADAERGPRVHRLARQRLVPGEARHGGGVPDRGGAGPRGPAPPGDTSERARCRRTASSSPAPPSPRAPRPAGRTPERGDDMGLISEVLLLPLAPARAYSWAVRQVLQEAERIYYDPRPSVPNWPGWRNCWRQGRSPRRSSTSRRTHSWTGWRSRRARARVKGTGRHNDESNGTGPRHRGRISPRTDQEAEDGAGRRRSGRGQEAQSEPARRRRPGGAAAPGQPAVQGAGRPAQG